MTLRGVLFDLDGTLHDRAATIRGYLEGHVERFGLPAGYAGRWTALDDLGYLSKAVLFPQIVAEFGLNHDPQLLLQDFDDHAWATCQPMPQASEVLGELRQRGVRTGVVTNGWTVKQLECLNALGLTDLLDDVVVSEAVGLRKPDPAIFRLALSRLGLTPEATLFVGDSPVNDIQGPQAVGMRAALFPGGHPCPEATVPDYRLNNLRDLLPFFPPG